MKKLNQNGSHILAVLLLLVVLGVIGFAGYTVMHRNKKATTTANAPAVTVPSTIQSKADLSSTAQSLDSASSSLNSSVDSSSLDSNMSDLL